MPPDIMPLPSKVRIVEIGPRDGLQNEKGLEAAIAANASASGARGRGGVSCVLGCPCQGEVARRG